MTSEADALADLAEGEDGGDHGNRSGVGDGSGSGGGVGGGSDVETKHRALGEEPSELVLAENNSSQDLPGKLSISGVHQPSYQDQAGHRIRIRIRKLTRTHGRTDGHLRTRRMYTNTHAPHMSEGRAG